MMFILKLKYAMPCSALIEYLLLLENVSQNNEMAQRSYKCYELVATS